ncbi:MAG: TrkH family potassium uptake protein [Pseudomonadota bacterium]
MLDLRPVFFVVGLLLSVLAFAMLVPAAVDLALRNEDWQVFAGSSAVTLFFGMSLFLSSRRSAFDLNIRQAFILTVTSWVTIAAFAALPFAFSELGMSYTDAFFESMSGVTTTGSTVINYIEGAPPGILMWRALLQWMGGIGIIVMALSILPMLRVGGMQLFRMESSDTSEKVLPRAAQIATSIALVYVALTLICAAIYSLAGMTVFDGVAHAMTTIATGGFSTKTLSISYYDNALIDATGTLFMLLGGLPFVLYLQAVRGRFLPFVQDSQVRWFLSIVVVSVGLMAAYLTYGPQEKEAVEALRLASFNVVSIITGTGYATDGYDDWGMFALVAFFFLMFAGGCAGSTSCGIKIFRIQVLYANVRVQIGKLLHPHGVFISYYNRKPIPDAVMDSVMSFFFLFIICFGVLSMALGLTGLDFLTAVSSAGTAIANVGPGLGPIVGPVGSFAPLSDEAKWLLSFGMLLGRLELFTVLVLFSPQFWRT